MNDQCLSYMSSDWQHQESFDQSISSHAGSNSVYVIVSNQLTVKTPTSFWPCSCQIWSTSRFWPSWADLLLSVCHLSLNILASLNFFSQHFLKLILFADVILPAPYPIIPRLRIYSDIPQPDQAPASPSAHH